MNNLFKYIFIGFIQGLTEFLPISSSGHIVIFGSLFDFDNLMLLSIAAHVGTLFAVLFCYRKTLLGLINRPFNATNFNLVLATIPTVVIVIIFHSFLDTAFSLHSIIWGFLISAVLLFIADIIKNKNRDVDKPKALIMGLGQGLALVPGISRSGTTLCFGLISGVNRQKAVDFSFLMSIPVILCSAVYEILKFIKSPTNISFYPILVVMLSSFVFGIISIKLMLRLIKKNALFYFSIYLIVLSILLIILL